MRTILTAVLLVLLGSGCAISEIKRVNQKLKAENDRLLMENRDLRTKAARAERIAEDRKLELERLRQELALARRKARRPSEPVTGAGIKQASFKGIEDIDVIREKNRIRLVLSNKVFFKPGSAVINQRGRAILAKVAAVLKKEYGNAMIRVDGHTDNTPIRKTKAKYASNWELSSARACAVTRYLINAGVDPNRIYAAAFAYHKPVASNATAGGRQKNRRVEIVILGE